MATLTWRDERARIGDADLLVQKTGSGPPLLLLHEELGCPGTVGWQEELAKSRTLIQIHHPGFGRSERVEWVENVRDLASLYAMYLRGQGMTPIDVMGFSFGGWLAAEMIAQDPSLFGKMVLVGAVGIQPPSGEILDMFMLTGDAYLMRTVKDAANTPEFIDLYGEESPERYEAFDEARAETARLAWKPYLFNRTLPHLLEAAVDVPTLIVWGAEDAIVPTSVGEAYQSALRNSKLVTIPKSGHRPEIEQRDAFLSALQKFLA